MPFFPVSLQSISAVCCLPTFGFDSIAERISAVSGTARCLQSARTVQKTVQWTAEDLAQELLAWLQDWFCEYAQWNVELSHPFTPFCVA